MKKVILALAVLSVGFVACNDSDKKVEETTNKDTTVMTTAPDTTLVVKDSTVKTTVTTDTIKK